MKIYLIRHGETISKALNSGIFNTALSDKGIEQAKRTGQVFKNKKIDVVYCSELERANETLDYIKPFLANNIKIISTSNMNEISKGTLKTNEEYRQALKKSGLKDHEFRPYGGENYFDVEKRAQEFLHFLRKNHPNDTVLLVGHGIFFRLLMLRMLKLHMREMMYFSLECGSISYFEEKNWKIINSVINNCSHLLHLSSYQRKKYPNGTDQNKT